MTNEAESRAARPQGIARQVLDASDAAGRLVLPAGQKAVVTSYSEGRYIAFVFEDGSELDVIAVRLEDAYAAPVGENQYRL